MTLTVVRLPDFLMSLILYCVNYSLHPLSGGVLYTLTTCALSFHFPISLFLPLDLDLVRNHSAMTCTCIVGAASEHQVTQYKSRTTVKEASIFNSMVEHVYTPTFQFSACGGLRFLLLYSEVLLAIHFCRWHSWRWLLILYDCVIISCGGSDTELCIFGIVKSSKHLTVSNFASVHSFLLIS